MTLNHRYVACHAHDIVQKLMIWYSAEINSIKCFIASTITWWNLLSAFIPERKRISVSHDKVEELVVVVNIVHLKVKTDIYASHKHPNKSLNYYITLECNLFLCNTSYLFKATQGCFNLWLLWHDFYYGCLSTIFELKQFYIKQILRYFVLLPKVYFRLKYEYFTPLSCSLL